MASLKLTGFYLLLCDSEPASGSFSAGSDVSEDARQLSQVWVTSGPLDDFRSTGGWLSLASGVWITSGLEDSSPGSL